MALRFCPPATERCATDYIPLGPTGQDRYYPSPQPIRTLMGRYRGELRAPNVFKLVAGGYTTVQPYESTPGSVIAFTYLGGHCWPVSSAEAELLIEAGYAVENAGGLFPAPTLYPSTFLYPETGL